MSYTFYIILGVLPSVVWLLFYLQKDVHPESNRMILKIFFYGMLATLPAILLEKGIFFGLERLNLSLNLFLIIYFFFGVALVEESLKYLVVKGKVLKSSELDEPLDVMIYMIIAALGFAALENILILCNLGPTLLLEEAFSTSAFRFLGATFLHALCSGTLGYFLALSFYRKKMRFGLSLLGLGIAAFLHGLYNFSIIGIEGNLELKLFILALILIGLAVFVTLGFKRLKKLKSICKI